tara:strand:+ start:30 stop:293 length:264 start_codon:yes stop_codon:yes gene_type:complete
MADKKTEETKESALLKMIKEGKLDVPKTGTEELPKLPPKEYSDVVKGITGRHGPTREMTIEEILDLEKKKIRAAELKKQEIVEKKRK